MWGYDNFISDTRKVDEVFGRVCGTKCKVKRNAYGPTSFASAVAKKYRDHDQFSCPHTDAQWHMQALDLVLNAENCPSKRVKELIKLDLEYLLEEHLAPDK